MFLEDESSEARPWFHTLFDRGRMALLGMVACTAMLTALATTAHAAAPQHGPAPFLQSEAASDAEPTQLALSVAVDPMPTASTPLAAPLIATASGTVVLPPNDTLSDRYILLGLMMLCFAAMTAGSLALWRRSLKELLRTTPGRHDV